MVEPVSELVALRRQVTAVLGVRRHLDRHLLDHREAVALEPGQLLGVVREDADRAEPEFRKDLVPDAVVAGIGGKAELEIRIDGIETVLLELVRPELVEQPDNLNLPVTLFG